MRRLEQFRFSSLVVGLAVILSGCGGWYLRGTENPLSIKRVFITRPATNSYLYSWFVTQLSYNNVQVVARAQAEAVIELRNEQYDRRVLSVDPDTGKVREVELGLQVEMTVRGPTGNLISPPDTVSWVKDFVFDEGSLLGTEEVEITLRSKLAEDAARALMIRLETIDFKHPGADAS